MSTFADKTGVLFEGVSAALRELLVPLPATLKYRQFAFEPALEEVKNFSDGKKCRFMSNFVNFAIRPMSAWGVEYKSFVGADVFGMMEKVYLKELESNSSLVNSYSKEYASINVVENDVDRHLNDLFEEAKRLLEPHYDEWAEISGISPVPLFSVFVKNQPLNSYSEPAGVNKTVWAFPTVDGRGIYVKRNASTGFFQKGRRMFKITDPVVAQRKSNAHMVRQMLRELIHNLFLYVDENPSAGRILSNAKMYSPTKRKVDAVLALASKMFAARQTTSPYPQIASSASKCSGKEGEEEGSEDDFPEDEGSAVEVFPFHLMIKMLESALLFECLYCKEPLPDIPKCFCWSVGPDSVEIDIELG